MNSDVRDILELSQPQHQNKISKKKKIKRLIETVKRPQGVHREVWGLINKDDRDQATPLIPVEEPKIYKHPKAKLRHGVRKWHWCQFKNPARTDSALFSHWRCVNDDPNKEYPFAKYNKQITLLKYTDAEYTQHLSDENWTKAETDYLFELCKAYDLRFFIIHDRWDVNQPFSPKTRTVDELKDRYYKVTGQMQKLKAIAANTPVDESQIYVFDLEHEQKRREQLEKLFNRTKEQIEEEIYLTEELKKIEISKKERERKQQDVNKLLTAVVDLENTNKMQQLKQLLIYKEQQKNKQQQLNQPVTNSQRTKQRKSSVNDTKNLPNKPSGQNANISGRNQISTTSNPNAITGNESLNSSTDGNNNLSPLSAASNVLSMSGDFRDTKNTRKSLIFKAVVESGGIKFPDNKLAGVSLRSYKMKLPPSVGLKKTKAIEQLLEELQIDNRPLATENVCDQFNDLRSDIVLLYELQQALTNCEFELQTFRHRYEPILAAKNIDMSLFETTLNNGTTTGLTSSNEMQTTFGTEIPSSSLLSVLSSNNTPQKRISEIFDVSTTPSGPLERRRKAALNQTNILKRLRGRNP